MTQKSMCCQGGLQPVLNICWGDSFKLLPVRSAPGFPCMSHAVMPEKPKVRKDGGMTECSKLAKVVEAWKELVEGGWNERWGWKDWIRSEVMCKYRSEKATAPHSSTLAWKIPWMKESGGLQSMGSLRVGHDWATSLSLFTFIYWRMKWQPTPVFLPGESQGQGSLVGCCLWGRTESDTTEAT